MYFETLGIFSTYVKCSDYVSFIISILNSYCYGRWLIRLIILNQFTYLYIYMEINQLSEHKKKKIKQNKTKYDKEYFLIVFFDTESCYLKQGVTLIYYVFDI